MIIKCGDLNRITNGVELRHSFCSRVPIMLVTHNVKGKVKMRVVGSVLVLGSAVGLSGVSELVARYRRMD